MMEKKWEIHGLFGANQSAEAEKNTKTVYLDTGGDRHLIVDDIKAGLSSVMEGHIDEGVSDAIIENMQEAFRDAENDDLQNTIFIATAGRVAIRAIHVPRAALNGTNGPVLFPTANPKSIIAAFSTESLRVVIDFLDTLEPGPRKHAWEFAMEKMVEMVDSMYEASPPKWGKNEGL